MVKNIVINFLLILSFFENFDYFNCKNERENIKESFINIYNPNEKFKKNNEDIKGTLLNQNSYNDEYKMKLNKNKHQEDYLKFICNDKNTEIKIQKKLNYLTHIFKLFYYSIINNNNNKNQNQNQNQNQNKTQISYFYSNENFSNENNSFFKNEKTLNFFYDNFNFNNNFINSFLIENCEVNIDLKKLLKYEKIYNYENNKIKKSSSSTNKYSKFNYEFILYIFIQR
jgi:hypothetical protein